MSDAFFTPSMILPPPTKKTKNKSSNFQEAIEGTKIEDTNGDAPIPDSPIPPQEPTEPILTVPTQEPIPVEEPIPPTLPTPPVEPIISTPPVQTPVPTPIVSEPPTPIVETPPPTPHTETKRLALTKSKDKIRTSYLVDKGRVRYIDMLSNDYKYAEVQNYYQAILADEFLKMGQYLYEIYEDLIKRDITSCDQIGDKIIQLHKKDFKPE